MIFAQMLEIVALSDLAAVLVLENSRLPPPGGVPQIVLFPFIIIILLLLLLLFLKL